MGLFGRIFQSRREASYHWPTATGEISELEVRPTQPDGLVAEICYSYCADGEYYSGVFQKKFPPFACESRANEYIARFENVSKIRVHYRPGKPEVSTLCEQDMNVD